MSRSLRPRGRLPAATGPEARRPSRLLLLGNVVPLWETMLAAMKIGVVLMPSNHAADGRRIERPARPRRRQGRGGDAGLGREVRRHWRHKLEGIGDSVGAGKDGWLPFEDATKRSSDAVRARRAGPMPRPMLLYFTSGTTAKPKLVRHQPAQLSGRVLSTMYWLGLQPGDVHLNISSPGWAKHAWSCFFAPWNAGGDDLHRQPAALRGQGTARRSRPLRRHHVVRAADGVAAVHPGEARRRSRSACVRSAAPAAAQPSK